LRVKKTLSVPLLLYISSPDIGMTFPVIILLDMLRQMYKLPPKLIPSSGPEEQLHPVHGYANVTDHKYTMVL